MGPTQEIQIMGVWEECIMKQLLMLKCMVKKEEKGFDLRIILF